MPANISANCSVLLSDSDLLTRAIFHKLLRRTGYPITDAGDQARRVCPF